MAFPALNHVALTVRDMAISGPWGSGLSFRDPDGIALEFFAPPGK